MHMTAAAAVAALAAFCARKAVEDKVHLIGFGKASPICR
jgi:hypothetical protein